MSQGIQRKFGNILNSAGKITKQIEFKAIKNSLIDSSKIVYRKKLSATREFSYNRNGQINKQSTIDSNGKVISEIDVKCMEFDEFGNCLKIKTLGNNMAAKYTHGEIRYYN